MNRREFENAVEAGLDSSPRSGHKWRPLENYFAREGVRVGCSAETIPKQLSDRIRQVFVAKKHGRATAPAPPDYGVFVLRTPALEKDAVSSIGQQANSGIRSVLLLLEDNRESAGARLRGLRLLLWRDDQVSDLFREWYCDAAVVRIR